MGNTTSSTVGKVPTAGISNNTAEASAGVVTTKAVQAGGSKHGEFIQGWSARLRDEPDAEVSADDAARVTALLQAPRTELQLWAANLIAFTCRGSAINRQRFSQSGALEHLLVRLTSQRDDVIMWSLSSMANICIGQPEASQVILSRKQQVFPRFTQLLNSPSDLMARRTANALGIVCMDSEECSEAAGRAGAVEALARVLSTSAADQNVRTVRWVIFALGALISVQRNRDALVKFSEQRAAGVSERAQSGISVMTALVHTLQGREKHKSEYRNHQWATQVIGLLCVQCPQMRDDLGKAGGVGPLVEELRKNVAPEVTQACCFALGHGCQDHAANRAACIAAGGLDALVDVVQEKVPNVSKDIRKEAALAVVAVRGSDADCPIEVKRLIAGCTLFGRSTLGRHLVRLVTNSDTLALKVRGQENPSALPTSPADILRPGPPRTPAGGSNPVLRARQLDQAVGPRRKDTPVQLERMRSPILPSSSSSSSSSSLNSSNPSEQPPLPPRNESNSNESEDVQAAMSSRIAWKRIHLEEEIGQSLYGTVYRGRLEAGPENDQPMAVTVRELLMTDDPEVLRVIARESVVRVSLRHAHIAEFVGVCIRDTGIYVVERYVESRSLAEVLRSSDSPPSFAQVLAYLTDLADALAYLHAHFVIHRDLTPESIAIGADGSARIAEFGFARRDDAAAEDAAKAAAAPLGKRPSKGALASGAMTVAVGKSDPHRAPEISLGGTYSLPVDVYSFGILAYEMLTKKEPSVSVPGPCSDIDPWAHANEDAVRSAYPAADPATVFAALQIVARCAFVSAKKRPSASELLVLLQNVCLSAH